VTPDDCLNAAIVIKAIKVNSGSEFTEDVIVRIRESLERRSLQLDDEQIKSGWECLSHI
jgi:hypothetical protein